MQLVLASANPDKTEEVRALFAEVGLQIESIATIIPGWGVEETGGTIEQNARLKAGAATAATGEPSIADDTGLFVDALDGAPGVRSSRYAGKGASYADNVRKLLANLEGVPAERRAASFRTVALIVTPDGREASFEGVLEGSILDAPRGERGFGYDPVFLVPELGLSLAELTPEEKNRVSHRGRAFGAAAAFLAARPGWLTGREKEVAR